MLKFLKKWLGKSPAPKSPEPMDMLRKSGSYRALKANVKPSPAAQHKTQPNPRATDPGKARPGQNDVNADQPIIEELGPGKNVLVRRRMVREESGTHETLTILDDSIVDGEEESGLDPYNTGRFDRSKYWDKRFLK